MTLKVYPGASGHSIWYEDAGDGFGYERGDHMEVACDWDDQRRTLNLTRSGDRGAGTRVRIAVAGSPRMRDVVLRDRVTRIRLA